MRAVLIAMALLVGVLTGCARHAVESSGTSGERCVVASASTNFYRYGPQQAGGPDRKLPRNSAVTVINRAFGYAHVKLSGGEQGYVARADLRPAAAAAPSSRTVSSSETQRRIHPQYAEPALPPPEQGAAPSPSP